MHTNGRKLEAKKTLLLHWTGQTLHASCGRVLGPVRLAWAAPTTHSRGLPLSLPRKARALAGKKTSFYDHLSLEWKRRSSVRPPKS